MINEGIAAGSAAFAGYYETARSELLGLLEGPAPARVLEVGCGGGANLAWLKQRWPGLCAVGIELRAEAAARARAAGADEVLQADVLQPDCDFAAGHFDVIVLSHVLEHFAQPERVLAKVAPWLRAGGQLLVALPNVRHVSVLLPLLLRGEFEYRDSGILDRTHLRFYTRASAQRLLEAGGFEVRRLMPEFGGRKSHWLNRLSLGAARDFAAYAYNLQARKP